MTTTSGLDYRGMEDFNGRQQMLRDSRQISRALAHPLCSLLLPRAPRSSHFRGEVPERNLDLGKRVGTLAKRTQKNDCLASWVPLSLDCVRLERWRSAHPGRKGDHQTVSSGLEILLLLEDGTFMNVPGVKEENWVQSMTRRREGSLHALRQWWRPVCLSTTVSEIRHMPIWAKALFLWAAFKWGLT